MRVGCVLTKPVRHDQLRAASVSYSGYSRDPDRSSRNRKTPTGRPTLITRHTLAEQAPRPGILVAETTSSIQKLAVRMLDRLGYQPDVVSNGQGSGYGVQTWNRMPQS